MNLNSVNFDSDLSPELFAKEMFESTSKDGELRLQNMYDVVLDDCLTCNDILVKIKWNDDSLNFLIANYKKLFEELKIISKNLDEFNSMYLSRTEQFVESTNGILNGEQLESTYFIFVAPFSAKTKEQLDAQIIGRIGDGLFGYEMILHAQRLCRLLSLGAPELIINNEARHLIACMAIYQCATSIETTKENRLV